MEKVAKLLFEQAFEENGDYYETRECKSRSISTLKKEVNKIAREVGVKLSQRHARTTPGQETWCWDGQTIASGNRSIDNIVHDIAHHQCSAVSRRHLPEWGLGTSPDGTKAADLVTRSHIAQLEEECASLLGVLWERKIGSNWTGTLDYHNWVGQGYEDCIQILTRTLNKLLRWGLIDKEGNPLPNMRSAKSRV